MTSEAVITFLESTAKELPERLLRDDELFCQYWSIGKSNYDWGTGATTDSQRVYLNDSGRFDYAILIQFEKVIKDMVRQCRKAGHTRNMACELIRENDIAWFRITSS